MLLRRSLFPRRLLVATSTLLACAAVVASAGDSAKLTVRVDARAGAPCLVVNGRPVRPRIFFGGPGSAPIKVEPAGRSFEFEFVAEADANDTGTIHFRFGQLPGDVFLDNIRIIDLASDKDVAPASDFESGPDTSARDWTSWPPLPANNVATLSVEPSVGASASAGLHVKIRRPPNGQWPDFHIYHLPSLPISKGLRYRVSFWAKAEPARDLAIALYRPGDPFVCLGRPPGLFETQIRMATAAGVDFVSFPIDMPWPAPGVQADWQAADNSCAQVLRANPRALLVPRLGADPPDWWRKAHPDDVMTWEDGSQQHHAVVASPRYRQDAAARVAALVEHLESKFGDHLAGYHPCGQNTGEWFYQDTWENRLNGYAPADTDAWRTWLRNRYRNNASLQAAWHDQSVTLASAAVPAPAQRRASPTGILRDPLSQKSLIDFAEFQQQAMANLVCDLAHAARQASRGRKLVMFFYGYLFEFGTIRLGPATCGHYALRRVLDCPDIDLLCSPISYFDRGIGGSGPVMTAAESVALAGKMWLCEDDTRTYLGTGEFPGQFDGGKDLPETRTLLRRNLAQEATRNFATWWMDLAMTGWFNDQRLWDDMRQFDPVDRYFVDHPTPFRPEVAAVIDEHAMLETSASAWSATEAGIYQVRRPLARMGAPYGQYLLDDVLHGRVHSKLYVFLNAWQLSAQQRSSLKSRTRGSSRVWCYAPGLHEDDRTSPDAMQALTGFHLVPVAPASASANPTRLGAQLGLSTPWGSKSKIAPLFAAADATPQEILATYPDGSPAVAFRREAGGWSLFVGPPGLTSDLLRLAARQAGVHLYTPTDCNVYANGPIIALHAAQEGEVALDTAHRSRIRDVFTGQELGSGPRLVLPLKNGETRVLRY